jgi:toxin FitB
MLILDTKVLSELMRDESNASVVHWIDRQRQSSIWITSITLMEIRYGLQSLPADRRTLIRELEAVLTEEIAERYASFDTAAARQAASLMAARKRQGRPIEFRDTMIAGIVMSGHAILATRNTAHFSDLGSNVVNPWNA